MRIVLDIEANGLVNPTQIWLIVCKDIDTGEFHIFRNVTSDDLEKERFLDFAKKVRLFIGHNFLGYDYPVLRELVGFNREGMGDCCIDTFIVSKLVDFPRKGHSLANYGEEFGLEKIKFNDWTKYSPEMETYCIRDVEINHKVYLKYLKYISNPLRKSSISLEHNFQLLTNTLSKNGFSFNSTQADKLLKEVTKELEILDSSILKEFPPRLKLIREVIPRSTKYGTLAKNSIPKAMGGDLSPFSEGAAFSYCEWITFNPSSHKQLIEVLTEAGWKPIEKTQTHIDTERELTRLKRQKERSTALDLERQLCQDKLIKLGKSGWKISEANLGTLPENCPPPARTLAKRILLEARRRTLTEWLGLVQDDGRIHGKFMGIGAWTHRMAHQEPNTANIPNEFDTNGNIKLLGKEMRALWQAPRNRLLVGVDAEGIQLRIFAHYIDDKEFTDALVNGKKSDKTDPHSLNQRILGSVCKSRQVAKRFIYALLLGAGISKLASVLECSERETKEALDRLLGRYTGWADLKRSVIPKDAGRGWFTGLDGRAVRILGETVGERRHLCMSGYLQNGEAVVMKMATLKWSNSLTEKYGDKWKLVNFVHDEWQTEVPNDMSIALDIAKIQAESLREVGEELNLKCPLAGSYYNEDHKDYTIGPKWSVTH